MNRPIKLRDRLIAETLGVGSLLVGNKAHAGDVRGFVPASGKISFRWRHARIPTDSIENWASFEGNQSSGWTPPNYKEAGILLIDKQSLDEEQVKHGGKQAVAYALGTTVMIGYGQSPFLFAHNKMEEDRYIIAMGIGKGVLQATAGIYTHDNEFLTTPGCVTAGPRMAASKVPNFVTKV